MSLTINPVNNGSLTSKVLPSPKTVDTKTNSGTKIVTFKGALYASTPSAAHTLRENILTIINDNQRVNIAYSGESGYDGSYFISSGSIPSVKVGSGFYEYALVCLYIGASQ